MLKKERKNSPYGGMKWLVTIPLLNGGKSKNWFRTGKEADYYIERYNNTDREKYTRVNGLIVTN